MDGAHLSEEDVVLLDDICEGCGQIVPCVVRYRSPIEKLIWAFLHRKDRK